MLLPYYHFNVCDGRDTVDAEGVELPDVHAARRAAIQFSGAVLEDEGSRLRLGEDWRMEVTDHTGMILFRMEFMVVETPATMAD